jgi:hypothetical protein
MRQLAARIDAGGNDFNPARVLARSGGQMVVPGNHQPSTADIRPPARRLALESLEAPVRR